MHDLKNKWQFYLIGFFYALLFFSACAESSQKMAQIVQTSNSLTDAEKADGWILLFDGNSFAGWHDVGHDGFPAEHWLIDKDAIKIISSLESPLMPDGQPKRGGDIITDQAWVDFELAFDWKISEGGNSGVKYNVVDVVSKSKEPVYSALGWEYQVIDDLKFPEKLNPDQEAGALYDMIEPTNKIVKPAGEWNTAKIVFIGNHGEHWLNGTKVVDYNMDTPAFEARFAKSKYAKIPGFKDKKKGHIVLQDHGGAAWYRNIKIKPVSK
jgi:hypothetical protein